MCDKLTLLYKANRGASGALGVYGGTSFAVKATFRITCAFSFGGAMDLSMSISIIAMGVIAMNLSTFNAVRVWCGATLLWRPGRLAPPNER